MNEFMWLHDGRKCRVLGWANDHTEAFVAPLVTREYSWGDEAETVEEDGEIISVPANWIFDSPPTEVLSKEVAALKEEAGDLQKMIADLKRSHEETAEWHNAEMERIAGTSKALAKLDEFLAGEITHYVIVRSYSNPSILTVDETIGDHWGSKKGRLLSLSPRKGRELVWKLSLYTDGSGADQDCIPCTSHEEALGKVQAWIDEQSATKSFKSRVIECAQKYDLVLPEGYIESTVEAERARLLRELESADTARAEKKSKYQARWAKWRER